MKDDKNYVYVKITVQDTYPRILLVRKVKKDKARYFGPKTAIYKVINTLKVLKKVFPFNHCGIAIDYSSRSENRKPLNQKQIEDHLKRCIGPCMYSVDAEQYRAIINQIIRFFEGHHEDILKKIKEEMFQSAVEKKFEYAAYLRDKLKSVEEIIEPQKISDPEQKDLDIINYLLQDEKVYFNLFQLRNGKLIAQENFILNSNIGENNQILTAFLEQYYADATDLPKEILIPEEVPEKDTIQKWLTGVKGQKVEIIVPERGKKNKLLELSLMNAQSFAKQSQIKWEGQEKPDRTKALEDLQNLLKIKKPIFRLECYDISHFSGTETVGSMVVFENGFPKKEDYRKFKLHQEESGSPNDFASMEETLTRRLKYLKPRIISDELKLRKPTKEASKTFKKNPQKTFFIIEKNKENIGYMQIYCAPNKKVLVEKIESENKTILQTLIKKIIEKTKIKRLYLAISKAQIPLYEQAGCQQIQKTPDVFKIKKGQKILVYDHLKYKEDSSFKKTPDLIIIDGGKGQLSAVVKVLKKYKLGIPTVSLAKREEEIFLPSTERSEVLLNKVLPKAKQPSQSSPIILKKDDPLLHMIQHIRNEAHRFAVSYHQKLRLAATSNSSLDEIYGIGPEIKQKLLQKFGSIQGIRNAKFAELEKEVGKKTALKLKKSF